MNEGKVSVQWLDKRPSRRKRFIDRIFSSLEEFTNAFISKTDGEMPFDYGERTQVGHLAQVACKCGYFTVQDYDVSLGEEQRKDKKKRYRPDLHVWVPERGGKTYTCCFEVKVDRNDLIPIDAKSDALIRRISTRLAEANDRLSKHGHPEAVYRCGLMALRVYCRESKWKKWGMKSKTYDDKVKGLTGELEHALHAITGAESKPNFWWRYFASRKVIQSGCWKEEGQLQAPPVGVFWIGSFRRS